MLRILSHINKHIVQNVKRIFKVILEIIGNSVLTPGQDLLCDFFFFNETRVSILNKFLKIKHSNTVHSSWYLDAQERR